MYVLALLCAENERAREQDVGGLIFGVVFAKLSASRLGLTLRMCSPNNFLKSRLGAC